MDHVRSTEIMTKGVDDIFMGEINDDDDDRFGIGGSIETPSSDVSIGMRAPPVTIRGFEKSYDSSSTLIEDGIQMEMATMTLGRIGSGGQFATSSTDVVTSGARPRRSTAGIVTDDSMSGGSQGNITPGNSFTDLPPAPPTSASLRRLSRKSRKKSRRKSSTTREGKTYGVLMQDSFSDLGDMGGRANPLDVDPVDLDDL